MASSSDSNTLPRPKALLFDFMGTCLDWESSIREGFETINPNAPIRGEEASKLAIDWRHRYFAAVKVRTDKQLPPEDIDLTHRRLLDILFDERGIGFDQWNESMRQELVRRWHFQKGTSRCVGYIKLS
jgi:2-haloacid dehalogenase